jgi:hypothetical protein
MQLRIKLWKLIVVPTNYKRKKNTEYFSIMFTFLQWIYCWIKFTVEKKMHIRS